MINHRLVGISLRLCTLYFALFSSLIAVYADCTNTTNLGICLRTDSSLYTRGDYNDFINKVDATMGTDASAHDHSGAPGKGPKIPDGSLVSSYSGAGTCPANQFEIADNRNAAPTCAQPSFSNLSGVASDAQIPASITRDNEVPASGTTQSANTVFAGPSSGAPAAPTFRALADADIPAIVTRDNEVPASGTTQSANTVFAGPSSGAPAAPTFRALTDADIPDNITASNYVLKSGDTMTGTLNLPANGLVAGTSQLVLSGGNVGIGTNTLTQKLTVAGNIDVTGNTIVNLASPVNSTDAATKGYVDAQGGGPKTKRIFITSTTYNGNLGGLSGADTKCQTQASAAGLTGTWKALLSDGTTNARDRIGFDWDYLVLVNGRPVAKQVDLWLCNVGTTVTDTLPCIAEIERDESGNLVPANSAVWTGSNRLGKSSTTHCSSWSSTSVSGTTGKSGVIDYTWLESSTSIACTSTARLYCVEQ